MNLSKKYERWMEGEANYSLQKIKPHVQYEAWEQGISRGSYSYKSSALSYVIRARNKAEMHPHIDQRGGLSIVQCLGKAAHQLVSLEATARSYTAGRGILAATEADVINALSEKVVTDVPLSADDITSTLMWRQEFFSILQSWQDKGDMEAFHATLYPEMQFAANQFTSAAELYGWPEPGQASGEIRPWQL